MKYFDIRLKCNKSLKSLPKIWTTEDKDIPEKEMFVMEDFSVYAKKLYESLIGIKKYYENDFNSNNIYTINNYIDLFNDYFNSLLSVLSPIAIHATEVTAFQALNGTSLDHDERFKLLENIVKDSKHFVFDQNGKVIGFTDSTYSKISTFAKHIFMIEKLCSFTTRKFWKNELTNFENLDLNKDYKILVKCIMPDGWRKEGKSGALNKYMQSKSYHSTSLIDQNSFYKTFFSFTGHYALLLIDYEDKDFICASPTDDYSEEVIGGKNLLKDKKIFSNVLLQDESTKDNETHKFFAEAVECETPKNILNNIHLYSEINLKQIKPKAVIAPNKYSENFAKQVAKEYGDIPVIIKKEI